MYMYIYVVYTFRMPTVFDGYVVNISFSDNKLRHDIYTGE